MNCLADKIHARNSFALRHLLTPIFVIFLILIVFQSTQAQEEWRVFTTQNSPLPTNFIPRVLVDRNNVKWIGTAEGLIRIEGNNWQIYDTTNTPLNNNGIFALTIDNSNNIWVAVAYNGIAKFDGMTLPRFCRQKGMCYF